VILGSRPLHIHHMLFWICLCPQHIFVDLLGWMYGGLTLFRQCEWSWRWVHWMCLLIRGSLESLLHHYHRSLTHCCHSIRCLMVGMMVIELVILGCLALIVSMLCQIVLVMVIFV